MAPARGAKVDARGLTSHGGGMDDGPVSLTSATRCGLRGRCGRLSAAVLALVFLLAALGPADASAGSSAAGRSHATTPPGPARAAPPVYHVYFGDLHGHTAFSDGKGTPEQAYAQGAAGGADFMALTDHREGLTATEWARTQSAAAAATTASFVALGAFEVKPKIGHLNIYGTGDLPPVGLDGAALYDWIAARGAIAEWNHPLRNSDDFSGYAHWTPSRDAAVGLLEVVNHGSMPLPPDFERSYVRALDKGWHVMPAANGDVHDATWITGNDERTALLATSLSRDALYEAMRARRGYATRLGGLVVNYTAGGAVMGTRLPARTGAMSFSVKVRGRDAAKGVTFSRLDVVTNGGKVVATSSRDGRSLDWTTTVRVQPGRYYYVRVWTKVLFGLDLKTAWTAPVWVAATPQAARPPAP